MSQLSINRSWSNCTERRKLMNGLIKTLSFVFLHLWSHSAPKPMIVTERTDYIALTMEENGNTKNRVQKEVLKRAEISLAGWAPVPVLHRCRVFSCEFQINRKRWMKINSNTVEHAQIWNICSSIQSMEHIQLRLRSYTS